MSASPGAKTSSYSWSTNQPRASKICCPGYTDADFCRSNTYGGGGAKKEEKEGLLAKKFSRYFFSPRIGAVAAVFFRLHAVASFSFF